LLNREIAMNRLVCLLAIGLHLLLCPSGAAGANGAQAEAVVRDLTDTVYRTLHRECRAIQAQPEHLYALVDHILLPHADLRKMSQWVLGKYWRRADEAQREAFQRQFRQLLVRTYATAIQTVSPENIHYLPPRDSGRVGQATVRTEIRPPGEPAVAIDYAMYRKRDRWLVYDVRVEGVSLVTNYRTTFAEQMGDKGVAGLIAALQRRNREEMSAETARHIRGLQARSCDAGTR
jgi:phospholipid transport system substrate-binding protein